MTVRDSDGALESCGFNVTVTPRICDPITVSQNPDPVRVAAGGRATVTVSAEGGCETKTFGVPGGLGWVTKTGSNQYTVEPPAGTAPGLYPFGVTATDAEGNTGAGTIEVRVTCPTITVNAGNNMTVVVKESIRRTATAEGGGGSHTFSLSIDPSSGLNLSIGETNGSITGSATTAGTYTVTVTATATNAPSCPSGSDEFIVTVDCPDIRVEGLRDLTVTKGASLPSMTATASGGQTPYTFRKKRGPSWVTVSSSGAIGGTATGDPGEYDVTVEATDDCGCKGTKTFKITVSCPTITVGGVRDVTVTKGSEIPSMTATASGGQTPYTFRRKSGPSWVTVSSSGAIGGTATGDLNEYDVTVEATDDSGCKGTKTFTITVSCPTITVGGVRDVTVTKGSEIPSMTATASGGQSPYTFTKEIGPSWVRVSTGGAISGRAPNITGTYLVTVKATDAGRCWGTKTFEIEVVAPPPEIDDIGDVEADVNKAISSITPSVSGGEEPYTFSVSGKPAGISFSTSTGVISGAPTALGTFNITVAVTDNRGEPAETDFTMYVSRALSIASISNVVVTWQLDMDPIQVSASGGRGSYTYDLESEPAGISISSSGRIGGTPTQLGSATVTVIVRDKGRRQEEESFTMTVALPGDFNGDGRRDATDAKLFNKKMELGRSEAGYDRRMDLNKDGRINYADFVILTGYIESDAAAQSGQ